MSMIQDKSKDIKSSKLADQTVYKILRTGRYFILGFYLLGSIAFLLHSEEIPKTRQEYFHNFQHFLFSAYHLHARAFFYLGTLAVIITPLVSIFVLIFIFFKERNKKFMVIAALVSFIIILSIVVGSIFHLR